MAHLFSEIEIARAAVMGALQALDAGRDSAPLAVSVAKAKAAFRSSQDGGQLAALENALRAEVETSAFYRRLVASLPEPETAAFRRLQEIEDGHTAIVRAELDSVTGSGFWFDIRVFDMED